MGNLTVHDPKNCKAKCCVDLENDVFTDGSVALNVQNKGLGAGVFCYGRKIFVSCPIDFKQLKIEDATLAEIFAICRAVELVIENREKSRRKEPNKKQNPKPTFVHEEVKIFTDSTNAMKSLELQTATDDVKNPKSRCKIEEAIQSLYEMVTDSVLHFTVHWVEGHKGCLGNEIADKLAKIGRLQHQRIEFGDGRTIDWGLKRIEKKLQKTPCSEDLREIFHQLNPPIGNQKKNDVGESSHAAGKLQNGKEQKYGGSSKNRSGSNAPSGSKKKSPSSRSGNSFALLQTEEENDNINSNMPIELCSSSSKNVDIGFSQPVTTQKSNPPESSTMQNYKGCDPQLSTSSSLFPPLSRSNNISFSGKSHESGKPPCRRKK